MKNWIRICLAAMCCAIACQVAAQVSRGHPLPTPGAVLSGVNNVAKHALVIGNGSYTQPAYRLKNPANDAELMAQSLRKLGFSVRKELNLGRADMLRVVTEFSAAVPEGGTAFVFYAGHGMQIGGTNYLIPVDMAVTSEQTVPMRSVAMSMVMDRLAAARSSVNILVFDACRNNPFQPASNAKYRSLGSLGLANIKAPRGTLVAYSTSPNQLAPDGSGVHSLYAKTLAAALVEPGVTLVDTFTRVGESVRKLSYDDQIPWFSTSMAGDYYFVPPQGTVVVAGQSPQRIKSGGGDVASRGTPQLNLGGHWYGQLNEREWSEVDWEIAQRVKHLTADELPQLEHQAKGGSVVAQTTLGLAWREGIHKADSGRGLITRYGANNGKSVFWLKRAASVGFAVAQVELAEMYYMGHGVQRDKAKARALVIQAAQSRYPRAQLDNIQMRIEEGIATPQEMMDALGSAMRATSLPSGAPLSSR